MYLRGTLCCLAQAAGLAPPQSAHYFPVKVAGVTVNDEWTKRGQQIRRRDDAEALCTLKYMYLYVFSALFFKEAPPPSPLHEIQPRCSSMDILECPRRQ